jgi:hypothetical protein
MFEEEVTCMTDLQIQHTIIILYIIEDNSINEQAKTDKYGYKKQKCLNISTQH